MFVQRLQGFRRPRHQARAAAQHRGMMGAIGGEVRLQGSGGDCVFEQVAGGAADVASHFRLAQGRQPIPSTDMIDAGGDGSVTVSQGTVEVKKDGSVGLAVCHDQGCNSWSIQVDSTVVCLGLKLSIL